MRVLVTRPEQQAGATAEQLAGLGFTPVALPLTRTVGLAVQEAAAPCDAVAATSANALRFADKTFLIPLLTKPFFAVGARTAAAAQAEGFSVVHDAQGDAGALASLVLKFSEVRRVLYLCGQVRRAAFEAGLRAAGIEVTAVETYGTAPAAPSRARLAAAGAAPLEAVLLYSLEGARALAGLHAPALSQALRDAAFFALSPRILDPLRAVVPETRMFAPSSPNETALLALLGDWARLKRSRLET